MTCSFIRAFQRYVPLNAINFSKIVVDYLLDISTLLQIFQKRISLMKFSGKYSGHFLNVRNGLQFQAKAKIQTKISYGRICLQNCKNPCNNSLCSRPSRSYENFSTDLPDFQNFAFILVVYKRKRLPVRMVVSNLK